jgi:hypothetical protein
MANAKTTSTPRRATAAERAKDVELAARPVANFHQAFKALDIIDDARTNVDGSAFLLDQCVTHGEHLDDQELAIVHVTRLLLADVAALEAANDKARAMILDPAGKRARKGRAQ